MCVCVYVLHSSVLTRVAKILKKESYEDVILNFVNRQNNEHRRSSLISYEARRTTRHYVPRYFLFESEYLLRVLTFRIQSRVYLQQAFFCNKFCALETLTGLVDFLVTFNDVENFSNLRVPVSRRRRHSKFSYLRTEYSEKSTHALEFSQSVAKAYPFSRPSGIINYILDRQRGRGARTATFQINYNSVISCIYYNVR